MSQTTTRIDTLELKAPQHDDIPSFADFNYYLPPATRSAPSTNDLALILGSKDQETRSLPIYDVRSTDFDLSNSLQDAGFTYITRPTWTKIDSSMSDEEIEASGYYTELEQVVKQLCLPLAPSNPNGTVDIKIYHLGQLLRGAERRTDFSTDKADSRPTDAAWNKPNRFVPPAPRVHIDFTRLGVEKVLVEAFGGDSEAVSSVIPSYGSENHRKRVFCFSLWRPLSTVKRDPLAACDARSVKSGELVKLPRIYPDGATGENVVVKAAVIPGQKSDHRWYWMSHQTPDEMMIIKVYDSGDGNDEWEEHAENGKVGCAPHCSFHIPGSENEAARESIENRIVVVLS